ncbi:cytochrome c oxidase assembly protein [Croceicoccus bisphenolivorans]|uniref:cytochrome c oxidase assembly protein n=1 Tax=Croceicoccus bisphenolivorans TaxID=1783232 RepID=UPI000837A303|nr:cytochrome c oxidase assembly protein [Croceicoccus bisphenolivorans]
MNTLSETAPQPARSNGRVALFALSIALGMLGLGYASVPLYRIFCQVTGLNGTTQRVDAAQANAVAVTDKQMSIRFDANTAPGLAWDFKPENPTETVTIGARDMATFLAKNNSDKPITGTATFNVTPTQAGVYFSKVQCFCFTEQTLQPGEEVRMPVLFYVDPAIIDDPDTSDIEQITLSYTFYESKKG